MNQLLETLTQAVEQMETIISSHKALIATMQKETPKKPDATAKVSPQQGSLLFALCEANGVPRHIMASVLHKYGCPTGFTHDVLAKDCNDVIADLTKMAKSFNKHFPLPKYLKDGTINPDWAQLEDGK